MIVIDASVALKWVLPEADSDLARALYAKQLTAPVLWLTEAANALWRYVRLSRISEAEAFSRLRRLANTSVVSTPIETDAEKAFTLAVEIDHPVYDCWYLALAIREGTYVVTSDNRFASAVRRHGKWAAYLKLLSETR